MTRKISLLLVLLICMNCIFTAASAYDSGWGHYKGPAAGEPTQEPVEIPTEEPVVGIPSNSPVTEVSYDDGTVADGLRSTGNNVQPQKPEEIPAPEVTVPAPVSNFPPNPVNSGKNALRINTFTLDSITLHNEVDEKTQQILDMAAGTKLSFASQSGDAPRSSFELAMQGSPLFTLALQTGTPHYISSNFLGPETYMIYPEDEFAEKLVTAFYQMMEKVSDDTSSLPDLDEVLAAIKSIRSGSMPIVPTTMNFNFTQDIDPSALMAPVMDIMTRFVSAEPTKNIVYRYTDFDPETFEFEWPAKEMLPEISAPASATTAMFFGDDIIALLDCLPQFFADNPELVDAINDFIIQVMNQTNPGTEIPEGTDVLNGLIDSLRESSQKLEDYYLNLKIDSTAYGSPVLITAEIGKPQDDVNSGMILTILPVTDYPQTAIEIAGDIFQGEMTIPLFRMLYNGEGGQSGVNFRYADPNNTAVEAAMYRNAYESGDDQITETTIYFDISGMLGTIKSVKTSVPNSYGSRDVFTQVTYEQSMMGQPLFTANFTAESTAGDALPLLTPADAVHASDMTDTDYENLAGTIFLQLMMIVMNFM